MVWEMFKGFIECLNSENYWFSLLGKLYGIYVAYRVFSKLWKWTKLYFLSPTLHLAADVKSYGKWAVVTGATDGIGKSYAELLAKRGMSVVLVSRSKDKLDKVASEIAKKFKDIETKCVVADFSQDVSIYKRIENEIKDLDIGVLVNNVGMLMEYPDYLEKLSDEEMRDVLRVNCFSVAYMTKMVIKWMSNKKKGIIINVSSLAGYIPISFLTLYCATKAFIVKLHFSKSLSQEYKSKGIVVQCVSPAFVATNMTKLKSVGFTAPGPDTYVSAALDTVGLEPCVSGCFGHELQQTLLESGGEIIRKTFAYNAGEILRNRNISKIE